MWMDGSVYSIYKYMVGLLFPTTSTGTRILLPPAWPDLALHVTTLLWAFASRLACTFWYDLLCTFHHNFLHTPCISIALHLASYSLCTLHLIRFAPSMITLLYTFYDSFVLDLA